MVKPIPAGWLLAMMVAACAAAESGYAPAGYGGASAGGAGDSSASGGTASRGSSSGGTAAAGTASGGTLGSNSGSGGTASNPIGDASTGAGGAVDARSPDAPGIVDPCSSSFCSGHGRCVATPQGASCACDEGFDPPDCSARNADYGRRLKIADNLADPEVFKLNDDHYVLTGTGTGTGFEFLESRDLVSWTRVASYNPSLVDPAFDYCFCWAPDLAPVDGKLYLYFSAHRGPNGATTCPPPSDFDVTTYRAASLDGSLNFSPPELLFQGTSGAQSRTQAGCPAAGCGQAIRIDPAVYAGRLYYVFFDRGNNIASVALNSPADFRLHAGPAGWSLGAFEESINEGPELLEHGGQFYLFFSAAWYNSQYATFYVMSSSAAELTRARLIHRLTTPVRRGNGNLIESHGHNSIATRRTETFNFFHQGVFDAGGSLIRRDTYRQRIAWNQDGTAISQNQVLVSWNALGGGNRYSLDLVLRDGSVIGPCIAVGLIGASTSTTFTGVCPDAGDRLVHKSEVRAFRLYASPTTTFVQVGETPYDGFSDIVTITAR